MMVAVNNLKSIGLEALQKTVQSVIRARYFPEIWYLTESWLQTIKGRRILILGYGLGMLGEALAKLGWHVTFVDPSVKALTELKKRFSVANLEGTFQQCELEKTPFSDRSFDAVLCVNVLEFSQDPREVLSEVSRLLVPSGHAVIATFNRFSFWGFTSIARIVRRDDLKIRAQFLDRSMFEFLLSKNGFVLDKIIPRANYLPFGGICLKFKIPIPGAYVALLKRRP